MNSPEMPPGMAARFVGQRVPRKEDARLLTGRGAYVDDIVLPGMLHAAFVRSQIARGPIRSIDLEAARSAPGVRAIYTAADLAKFDLQLHLMHGVVGPIVRPLADGRVAHVGEAIAIVIADDRYLAEDAANLVFVDCDAETPVVTMDQAADGPTVHSNLESNVAGGIQSPDDPELPAIFARAAHVVEGVIVHQRQAHSPMEGRGVVASRQGEGEMTIHLACQSPHMAALYFTQLFGERTDVHFRVLSKDVGGAFGLKVQPWREECAIIAAALLLGRPVKWIEDRLENLTSACQAREQRCKVRMAFDADARWLAAEVDFETNVGAFPNNPDIGALAMMMFPGPYRVAKVGFKTRAYYSNTVGQAAYRGPWMMESLARETMLDKAARQIGIDPIELRRRNLITAADQPHTLPTGLAVDRVTPRECLELLLEKLDLPAFRAEQAKARAEGRHLGLGVAVYVEPTTMHGFGGPLVSDSAHVRVEPSGKVSLVISTHSQGHGTQTTMAQVVADELGVPIADVAVLEDDSSRGGFGPGAGGSRQAVSGGGAAIRASKLLSQKIKRLAGHLLNANPQDITIADGLVRVAGVEEVTTTIKRIAQTAYYEPARLPPDAELGLEAQYRYQPPGTFVFSNAAHACVCELDAETGVVKILRWIASEDCGVMINPAIVEGQIAGGVAQAIGGVLMEQISYDAYGNPTAATFKDYLLPTAHDIPQLEYCHLVTPSASEGGFKGVGEGGAIIGPPTVVNAVADALSAFGAECLDLPLTPAKLLKLIDGT